HPDLRERLPDEICRNCGIAVGDDSTQPAGLCGQHRQESNILLPEQLHYLVQPRRVPASDDVAHHQVGHLHDGSPSTDTSEQVRCRAVGALRGQRGLVRGARRAVRQPGGPQILHAARRNTSTALAIISPKAMVQRTTCATSASAAGWPPSARSFMPSIIFRSITNWTGSKMTWSNRDPAMDR